MVHVWGTGVGGRNHELALAALGIAGIGGVLVAAAGSDGTDRPTDAAGGIVDGRTIERLRCAGLDPLAFLEDNNAYWALMAAGDLLLKIGSTGTNVNDPAVLMMAGAGSFP